METVGWLMALIWLGLVFLALLYYIWEQYEKKRTRSKLVAKGFAPGFINELFDRYGYLTVSYAIHYTDTMLEKGLAVVVRLDILKREGMASIRCMEEICSYRGRPVVKLYQRSGRRLEAWLWLTGTAQRG